jgi:hypothetical protein
MNTTTIANTIAVDADLVAEVRALRAEAKALAERQKDAEARLRAVLTDAEATVAVVNGETVVTLVACERVVIDREALLAAFPEAYEATAKTSAYTQLRFA